ncbi:PLP-dependent cysteine synthase family protein [Natronobacterium gregoryi]|uniref:Cysteine synthase n=2 Tax=Natronobacterium gregoryi TaxID=44930 RepID=L0AN17_NATGS|nr:PLP-dependent cysteine synthase family protein [Natronobacterium gregoryi]AFZ74475.1 cysteine synthase [Natronobacterium gregoryi SP2]ELY72455.1 cysteine synthase [Natronobacterium gregoryi SP2]PLK21778.1 cysteine synthase [Natronobacterium gregoryi SP2]SFJ45723.1 cysteine synthase A [Natronobacterium gregoryi]
MKGSILDTIGSPLVHVDSPEGVTVASKIESFNPGGSAKDRPALEMVRTAEREGVIEPGDWLVEPTSGNTGIGLALVCATRDYDLTIVMPADKSEERQQVMAAYGAALELVDGGMEAARKRAEELVEAGATQLGQFENPANPKAHYRTTGNEIVEQVGEREIDAFVAGVGTGGTISGIGRRLREEFPDVEIVAVEPERNAVLSTGNPGDDDFQGMGPGFVSENLERELIDRIETVRLEDAEDECRRLAREEGILVGQSSGATSLIARQVAEEIAEPNVECPEPSGAFDATRSASPEVDGGRPATDCPLVVTVFWDSGERYLSTGLFDRDESL